MLHLRPIEPDNVAPLFAPLHRKFIEMLRALPAEAWDRPTVAGRWRVRDVAAHLLDGDLRKLAAHRDGHVLAPDGRPPRDYGEIVALINSLNASGVRYAERLSARLLVDLLELTGNWVAEFVAALDPFAPAMFPVAWAGESSSLNWMDTGREYTERWHHQAQIRDAANIPLLLDDEWYEPLLSFSVRALPRTYASVTAAEGTRINLQIPDRDWAWCLMREQDSWRLYRGLADGASATVRIRRPDAWRLFYNAVAPQGAPSIVEVDGDRELGMHFIHARSVMV